MVRATIAFAVIALGAAAVIAQTPEGSSQLEARDLNNDLDARGDLEDVVDMDAREPELFSEEVDARELAPDFFDDIEAREYEAEELEARADAQDPLPADPSETETTPATPTPTTCTPAELMSQKQQSRVDKARAVLRSAKGKRNLSNTDRRRVNKARTYLRQVRRRKTWAAKRIARKCRSTRRKAGAIPSAKCEAASRFLQAAKSRKKTSRAARKSGAASKTTDSATTTTVNAGPTCTPSSGSSSRLRKRFTPRDIVDEDFATVFAREYEFDNFD